MIKRRLTKQQLARITANQNKSLNDLQSQQQRGLLIASYGKYADVLTETGNKIRCNVRQNLPALVVGDQLIWQTEKNNEGVVCAVEPRKSELYRIGYRGKKKLVAANLDCLLIVLAVEPRFTEFLLDSYLIAAELCSLKPVIVINKIDLLSDSQLMKLKQSLLMYEKMSYHVCYVSSVTKAGINELAEYLVNKHAAFVGSSGVGKSTLINCFIPEESLLTGDISVVSKLGRHTTTTSQLYLLPAGGVLIDSPGVRGFDLGELTTQQVYDCFSDIKPYIGNCKFRNCCHVSEPGCALQLAVQEGKVAASRVLSVQKLLKAIENE